MFTCILQVQDWKRKPLVQFRPVNFSECVWSWCVLPSWVECTTNRIMFFLVTKLFRFWFIDSQNPDISVLAARPPVGRLLHYTSLCYASASAHLPCTDVTVLHRYHQSTCPHNLVNDVQLLLLEEQHSSSLQSVVEKYYKIDENVQV